MAGAEKCCECPQDNCEYHAGNMYQFKYRHLQINPECRPQFKGLTATCAIVSGQNFSDECTISQWGVNQGERLMSVRSRREKFGYGSMQVRLDEIFKVNGEIYHEDMWYCRLDKLGNRQYYLQPLTFNERIDVWVYVEEHDKLYLNWIYSKKDIRAFRRNMRKLFGYDIPIMVDLKLDQELHSQDLAKSMIEVMRGKNVSTVY